MAEARARRHMKHHKGTWTQLPNWPAERLAPFHALEAEGLEFLMAGAKMVGVRFEMYAVKVHWRTHPKDPDQERPVRGPTPMIYSTS